MTVETFTTLMAWICVVNISIFAISALGIMLFRNGIACIHSKMFGIDKESLTPIYFRYLGNFKVLILLFNIGPYIALRIVG